MMQRQQFNSTNIAEAQYDADTRTLIVTFTSGKRYEYGEVPNTVWNEFRETDSAGTFFSRFIRSAGYPYQQLID